MAPWAGAYAANAGIDTDQAGPLPFSLQSHEYMYLDTTGLYILNSGILSSGGVVAGAGGITSSGLINANGGLVALGDITANNNTVSAKTLNAGAGGVTASGNITASGSAVTGYTVGAGNGGMYSTGSVVIGTNRTPLRTLDVFGTARIGNVDPTNYNPIIDIQANQTRPIVIRDINGNIRDLFGTTYSLDLQDVSGGVNAQIADDGTQNSWLNLDGGHVGIGISTPWSELQVNGNAAIGYSSGYNGPTNGLAVYGPITVGGNGHTIQSATVDVANNLLNGYCAPGQALSKTGPGSALTCVAATGAQGPAGPPGAPGAPGQPGQKGDPGPAGSSGFGWVTPACTINTSFAGGGSDCETDADHSPIGICQIAGYTTYTGACQATKNGGGNGSPIQGSIAAWAQGFPGTSGQGNVTGWSITCIGNQTDSNGWESGTNLQILCGK